MNNFSAETMLYYSIQVFRHNISGADAILYGHCYLYLYLVEHFNHVYHIDFNDIKVVSNQHFIITKSKNYTANPSLVV